MRFFKRISRKIKDVVFEIKYAVQRAKKGYCDPDVWEIDTWMTKVLPAMLEELADHHCGYPNSVAIWQYEKHKDEYAEKYGLHSYEETACHRFENDEEKKAFWHAVTEEASAEWERILREMATAFRGANHWQENVSFEEMEKNKNHAIDLLREYFFNLWD